MLTPDLDEYFIKSPGVAKTPSPFLDLVGIFRSKPITPISNRLVRNLDTAFCQKIFDISKAQTETVIEPHCVTDDFGWKAVTMTDVFLRIHLVSLPDRGLS